MTMCLNLLYRTLYFNNINILKHSYISCYNETKPFYTYQRNKSTYSSVAFNSKQYRDFEDINYDNLKGYKALRRKMIETGKYNTFTQKGIYNKNEKKSVDFKLIDVIKRESWEQYSISECVEKFQILSNNALINNDILFKEIYIHIILTLISKIVNFSDNELFTLLKCLELWPKISDTRNSIVRNLLITIDNELIKRSKLWSNKKTMMYCGTVCNLCNFYSNFVTISLQKLTSDCSKLSSKEIIHIMCILYVYSLPKEKFLHLEYCVNNYFNNYEISELQIICLAFFTSQMEITNKDLIKKFLRKFINNVNYFSDNDLSAFCKLFRYNFNSKPEFLELYEQLFESLIPIVPRVNTLVLTQISHLKAKTMIYNSVLMSAIIKRCEECLTTSRIKDIERVIFLLTTFNYPSHEAIYSLIIKELRSSQRREEKKNFTKEYGFALRHLSTVNIYPLDLISNVMEKKHEILPFEKESRNMGIENYVLDRSLRIECPDYIGQELDNKISKFMLNKYNDMQNDSTFANRTNQQILQIVNKIYEKDVASLYRILPHFTQNNIVLCFDHDYNAISALPMLKNVDSDIKWIPIELKRKYHWVAILLAVETVIIRNTKNFTGYLCANVRQLEKIGYIPIVIPCFEWKCNNQERKEYLKERILNSINLKTKK